MRLTLTTSRTRSGSKQRQLQKPPPLLSLCLAISQLSVASSFTFPEQAILEDVIPEGSPLCVDPGTTTITDEFDPRWVTRSSWMASKDTFDAQNYLLTMENNDVSNPNTTWSMRLGKGGSIYSFWNDLVGEVVPPQVTPGSTFVDDVMQMSVAVDLSKNFGGDEATCTPAVPYFIHQAGTYHKPKKNDTCAFLSDPDGSDVDFLGPSPFFSPTLAKRCVESGEKHGCSIASWGQQAHLATAFTSETIYFTKYRNCGGGVIEFTQMTQNIDPNGNSDSLNFHNLPWGGVRTSSLSDLLVTYDQQDANPGTVSYNSIFPVPTWPATTKNLRETAGYYTFSQPLPFPDGYDRTFNMPCYKISMAYATRDTYKTGATCKESDITNEGFTRISLKVQQDTPCEGGDDPRFPGRKFLNCLLLADHPDVPPRSNEYLWGGGHKALAFTNQRTADQIIVYDLVHMKWDDGRTYFTIKGEAADFNSLFFEGDEIEILWSKPGVLKEEEDALALTYVHGKNEEYYDNGPHQDFRYGSTSRDYTVATTRVPNASVGAGDSLVWRQYLILDRLGNMHSKAAGWVDETYSEIMTENDFVTGRTIEIYSSAADGAVFGAATADQQGGTTTSCKTDVVCSGRSVPTVGYRSYYYVTCTDATNKVHKFSDDPYVLAPARATTDDPIRPYFCDGMEIGLRPQLKLLGYFPTGSCASLENSRYDENYCTTEAPSSMPSTSVTLTVPPTPMPPTPPAQIATACPDCYGMGPSYGCAWWQMDGKVTYKCQSHAGPNVGGCQYLGEGEEGHSSWCTYMTFATQPAPVPPTPALPTQPMPCGCSTCTQDVLDRIATDDSGAHSCGSRIAWLQNHRALSEYDACLLVAQTEFPEPGLCGPCNPC